MALKKTIAIIGATGQMGTAIAKSLAKANYRLLLFSGNGTRAEELEKKIRQETPSADTELAACPFHACWEADIIIPAVPFAAEKDVAEKIREVSTQKVVISIANPLNESYDGLVTSANTSAAEELQKLLPNAKVVKAFNTTFASGFANPVIDGQRSDVFIAGDDEEAVGTAEELVSAAGFNPVIAGKLLVSRTLENMTALLLRLNRQYNYNGVAGWKILH